MTAPSPKRRGGLGKKVLALILVAILLTAALLVGLSSLNPNGGQNNGYNQNGNYNQPNDQTKTETWTGAIMPSSEVNQSGNNYVLVGTPDGQTGNPQTINLSSSTPFSDITGGQFRLSSSNGQYSLDSVVSEDSNVITENEVAGAITQPYTNIEVNITSISIVYSGYTFGIGSDGVHDYLWIGIKKSFPTLFNRVQITGTVMDNASLNAIASDFSSSVFKNITLSHVLNVAQDFGFKFNGSYDNFIAVTDLQYLETATIRGDVIDTITPSDINRLADNFSVPGTNWVRSVVGNIGEGCAILSQSDISIKNTQMWFMLYPTNQNLSFQGVCQMEVARTNLTIVTNKVTTLGSSPFALNFGFLHLNVGIILSSTSSGYQLYNVTDLWSKAIINHNQTIQVGCEIHGYGVIIDANTMVDSLVYGFGASQSTANNVANALTSFKNPAFILLINENVTAMIKNKEAPWHYAAIAIIPDYRGATGLTYISVKGVVYNITSYFSKSGPLQCQIPFLVADSCQPITTDFQNTTVTDIANGNVRLSTLGRAEGAYVDFVANTNGCGIKEPGSLALSILANLIPLAKPLEIAWNAFPLDAGLYFGDNGQWLYPKIVNIVDITGGQAPNCLSLLSYNGHMEIKGLYVQENVFGTSVGYVLAFSMTPV